MAVTGTRDQRFVEFNDKGTNNCGKETRLGACYSRRTGQQIETYEDKNTI